MSNRQVKSNATKKVRSAQSANAPEKSPGKLQPETTESESLRVHLEFNLPSGRSWFEEIDIPRDAYQEIESTAKLQDLNVDNFITTAVFARMNSLQPVAPTPKTDDVRTIGERVQKPSWLVVEMTDALDQFRRAMDDAGSLALLLISELQRDFAAHGRPVDFDFHEENFFNGLYGLERDFFMNLAGQVQRFEENHAGLMSRLSEANEPVMPIAVKSRETARVLMLSVGFDTESYNSSELQNCRGDQTELIELVSALINDRKGRTEGDFITRPVLKALAEAEDDLFKAESLLQGAGLAVAQRMAQSSERKAAA